MCVYYTYVCMYVYMCKCSGVFANPLMTFYDLYTPGYFSLPAQMTLPVRGIQPLRSVFRLFELEHVFVICRYELQ